MQNIRKMAYYNLAQELDNGYVSSPVTTGDRDKRMHLYYQLIHSMKNEKRIDIIVSFLMESGVKMLFKDLERAMDQGTEVRILTGNYLGITQPSATSAGTLKIPARRSTATARCP